MSKPRNRKPQNSQRSSQRKGRADHLVEYRFKPGLSGNPGGRPKKRPISTRYALLADVEVPERIRKKLKLPKGATLADAGVVALYGAMAEGKHGAAKEIREGIEGRAPQRIEFSGPDGEEIKAKVDARLSVNDLVGALRAIYGLQPQGPAPDVPVPGGMDQRQVSPQDQQKK
jgi:hypothetical protein